MAATVAPSGSAAPMGERQRTIFFKETKLGDGGSRCSREVNRPPLKDANGTPFGAIRDILKKRWQEKESQKEEGEEDTVSLRSIMQESNSIETVRKERVFDSEITEEEMDIIQQRVAIQQRQFAEYQRRELARKTNKIRSMFDYLNDEEIATALSEVSDDEEQVILNFTQPEYLIKIRKAIAFKYNAPGSTTTWDDEQREAYERLLAKRSKTVKKTTTEEAKRKSLKMSRLRLDDALKQLQSGEGDPEKVFEGWSEARIKAYKQIETNPNTYYYRFNAPGESQRNGAWTAEERKLFMKRLEELGADGQWGIFSMTIPGRVGYQCSNFYRNLLKSGEVKDPNYLIKDGKMHYLFGKKKGEEGTIRTHSKHYMGGAKASRGSEENVGRSSAKKKRKRKSRYGSDDEEDDDGNVDDLFDMDDSGNYSCKVSWNTTRRTRAKVEGPQDGEGSGDANPLPGFVDPITLEEVVKPAISPYGHVMGYENWVRCLTSDPERKNICPLTKKPLQKRELVILTHDNIDQYRDKIVNG